MRAHLSRYGSGKTPAKHWLNHLQKSQYIQHPIATYMKNKLGKTRTSCRDEFPPKANELQITAQYIYGAPSLHLSNHTHHNPLRATLVSCEFDFVILILTSYT